MIMFVHSEHGGSCCSQCDHCFFGAHQIFNETAVSSHTAIISLVYVFVFLLPIVEMIQFWQCVGARWP